MERQRAAQSATSATARQEASTAEKPSSVAVSSPPANASNSNASNNQDTGLADGECHVSCHPAFKAVIMCA